LGLASFVGTLIRNPRDLHFPELLAWLLFALFSMLQARLIAFFAVVAGPIALRNFQGLFAQVEWSKSPQAGRLRSTLRLATVLAFAGLLFLAWPGWLHGPFGDFQSQRRVACKLHIDPSLFLTAYQLQEWKEQGRIRNGFSPYQDAACYCAWFAPEVKGFMDYRLTLFPHVARTFVKVRRALRQEAQDTLSGRVAVPDPDFPEWRKLAADFDINHLILTRFDRTLVWRLWLEKKKWPVLYEDGRTLVFGWTDTNAADRRLIQDTLSRKKQAFAQVPLEDQPAQVGIHFPDVDRGFWRKYFLGAESVPLATAKAQLDQLHHQFWGQQWQRQYRNLWQASLVCNPAAFTVAAPAASLWGRDAGPPADPVLMMRHARLGVSAADHNAEAYFILFQACKTQWHFQEDHWSLAKGNPQGAPLRSRLRQIQAIAALKTCLVLLPEDHRVHEILAEMYLQLHYLDVALDHYSLALRYIDRLRPAASNRVARDNFDAYKKNLELKVRTLADEVKRRRADFDLRTAGLGPLEKYEWALSPRRPYRPLDAGNRGEVDPRGFGLANRALTELLQANIEHLNRVQQFQLRNAQMHLLLDLGRLQEVQEALPIHEEVLGPALYQDYLVLLAGAVGNYAVADEVLEEQINALQWQKKLPLLLCNYLQILAPDHSIGGPAARALLFHNQNVARILLQRAGELYLVRGLLALEKGDAPQAAQYFQKTLDLVGDSVFFPDRPIAQRYLQLIRKQKR